jgi:segregation and condensation protein A
VISDYFLHYSETERRVNSEQSIVEPLPAPAEDADAPAASAPRLHELRQASARQTELPFAVVQGKPITELPKDLYIPPEALEVFLEAFEGPLDLLLYLIKRQNLDILEINVSAITTQYMQYVNMMSAMQFELAAEYLLMAAMLAEIKSRMLLPRSTTEEDEEEDPRAQLIRRLQEYERFKKAAEDVDSLPRVGRESYLVSVDLPDLNKTKPEPHVDLKEMMIALAEVLRRADLFESHHVQKEKLSTRERMSEVLARVSPNRFTPFVALFSAEEGRLGVVVTFLAIMELIKESLIEIVQTEPFGPIHVKARSSDALSPPPADGDAESI